MEHTTPTEERHEAQHGASVTVVCGSCTTTIPSGAPKGGTGRYLLFLKPGDSLLPDFAEKLDGLLQGSPGIVLLASYADAGQSCLRPAASCGSDGGSLPLEKALRLTSFTPWCKLIRQDLLPGPPPQSLPDEADMLGALLHSGSIRLCDQPLLVHPGAVLPAFPPGTEGAEAFTRYARRLAAKARSLPRSAHGGAGTILTARLLSEGYALAARSTPRAAAMLHLYLPAFALGMLPSCGFSRLGRAYVSALGLMRETLRWQRFRTRQIPRLRRKAEQLRDKETINVLFIAIDAATWKSDSLMQAMLKHPRFNPRVLIAPEIHSYPPDTLRRIMDDTRACMESRGYPTLLLCDERGEPAHRGIPAEYDILVYPKPYVGSVPRHLSYQRYKDRLWVSIGYGFHCTNSPYFYQSPYQKFSWLDCFENASCAELAERLKQDGTGNSLVTGLPVADSFLCPAAAPPSPWKPQPQAVKKIIWAPHWTICPGPSPLYLSHFLEMAEGMLELARLTEGRIQWAFKPHPLLHMALCRHGGWEEERVRAYYARWENGANTQLETGDYAPLFMHSDAMVHDSSSFCCDYHLTGKPVLFLAHDLHRLLACSTPMARAAIKAHYIGSGMGDVEHFVKGTVLGGNDPMKPQREAFREQYLVPPHGRSAAENIIEYILAGKL